MLDRKTENDSSLHSGCAAVSTSSNNHDLAATIIQKNYRGFFSRKATNHYGASEGKEIEIYIPLGIKKRTRDIPEYEMVGGYGCILYRSSLFHLQIDYMQFHNSSHKFPIIEIVTVPYRSPDACFSNLPSEEEVDRAVYDLLAIIEKFSKSAASGLQAQSIKLDEIIQQYNLIQEKNQLCLDNEIRKYLNNPVMKDLFTDNEETVEEHVDIDMLLIFDKNKYPVFNTYTTPSTESANDIVKQNRYKEGILIIHIQKTFSLQVEYYHPDYIKKSTFGEFNITEQQYSYLSEAHQKAISIVSKYPLPIGAHRDRVLGLITICAERVIMATKRYSDLHEHADKPVLYCRHILHYIKMCLCNDAEKQWFDDLFKNHFSDIKMMLCDEKYSGDHRRYGISTCDSTKYDAIFDLFGDFSNKCKMSREDIDNPLSQDELKVLYRHGNNSWNNIYHNHSYITGRSQFQLQATTRNSGNGKYAPLFEARRIGIMTISEFKAGKSQVHLPAVSLKL